MLVELSQPARGSTVRQTPGSYNLPPMGKAGPNQFVQPFPHLAFHDAEDASSCSCANVFGRRSSPELMRGKGLDQSSCFAEAQLRQLRVSFALLLGAWVCTGIFVLLAWWLGWNL